MNQHDSTEFNSGHAFFEWPEGKRWLRDTFRKHVFTLSEDGLIEKVLDVEGSPSTVP